jgi:hypothetical protein
MSMQNAPILEAKMQAYLKALAAQGGKPLYTLSSAEARKVLEDTQTGGVRKLPVDREDRVLPVGPTGEVSARISRPQESRSLPPSISVREYLRRRLSNLQTQAEN